MSGAEDQIQECLSEVYVDPSSVPSEFDKPPTGPSQALEY